MSLRHRDRPPLGGDYHKLWCANAISVAGDGVTLAAGPLLVASVTRDPLLVAGAAFAQELPWLLFALISGVVVDRMDPRRLMVVVDLLRAAAIGGLAVSVAAGSAHLAAIYAALFVLGVGSTLTDTAAISLTPAIVAESGLTRANAGLQGVQLVGGTLVAPPLGAYLFVLATGLPFAFDAATFVLGAALLASIRRPVIARIEREYREGIRREIATGIRWLMAHPGLRMLAASICLMNITLGSAMAILVLYARQRLGLGPVGYGLLLSCSAVGGVIGTLVVDRLTRRLGPSLLLRVGLLVECATHVSLALTRHPWVAGATFVVFGVHAGVWGVVTVTLRQRAVPAELRGRVNSVYFVFSIGGGAIGSLLGGVLARAFGITAPFWVAAVAIALLAVVAWRLFTPARLAAEQEQAPSAVPAD